MQKLIIILFFIVSFLIAASCKKSDYSKKVTSPSVDTAALLTANPWLLSDLWIDSNGNGVVDPNEVIPYGVGANFNAYTFYSNDSVKDTVMNSSNMLAWHFIGNSQSSFILKLFASDSSQFQIIAITDTSMKFKVVGTNTQWWLTKY